MFRFHVAACLLVFLLATRASAYVPQRYNPRPIRRHWATKQMQQYSFFIGTNRAGAVPKAKK